MSESVHLEPMGEGYEQVAGYVRRLESRGIA